MDHKEQHHQQKLHEREDKKKHHHYQGHDGQNEPNLVHPAWFVGVGIALMVGVLLVWIFVW